MSSLTLAEIESAACQMGFTVDLGTDYVSKKPDAEDSKFKQMPAAAPRTSRVETLFTSVARSGNLVITWVKEKLPQKIAVLRFRREQKNALEALRGAIGSPKLGEKVEKFNDFLKFDQMLTAMYVKDRHLPEQIMESHIGKLREIFAQHFDGFDQLIQTLYNTCTYPYVESKVFNELTPVHESICKFLKFYTTNAQHREIIFTQSRYCRLNA